MFEIEFENDIFILDTDWARIGGSANSMGRFIDPNTGEYWLGKSDVGENEIASLILACKEKLANDIYGYYGIRVPRLRISRQALVQPDLIWQEQGISHAYHVMSRWLDRFTPYGYLPVFSGGEYQQLRIGDHLLPEKGLGHILAVAYWLNDIDVLSPSGGNAGYQLQLDKDNKLYALSCKIDPGYAFSNFKQDPDKLAVTETIQLTTQGNVVCFVQLSKQTQQEYLLTLKKISETSNEVINSFFPPKVIAVLESIEAKRRDDYVPVNKILQQLQYRRQALLQLYAVLLNSLQNPLPVVSSSVAIAPVLQRLYCHAKLSYENEVKEKLEFYIPLDVSTSPLANNRITIDEDMQNFLAEASQKEVMLLLGYSGAGKSLYTQQLVNQLWVQHQQDSKIPIPLRIELKQFTQRTIRQCIINTLLDEYHYSREELGQLKQYRFVFILDGYDEIAGQEKVNLLEKFLVSDEYNSSWKGAQFIITCRDNYFTKLSRSLFYGKQGEIGLVVRYLSPITFEKQRQYLVAYRQKHIDQHLPDYETLLNESPHLQELLTNPLILRIFRDALPQWQKQHPQTSLNDLTRYDLYEAFMTHWFASEAVRQSMLKAQILVGLANHFEDFSKRLSLAMYQQKLDAVNLNTPGSLWDIFFASQEESLAQARMGCPLKRVDDRYYFVHKSFLEYFVAKSLGEALQADQKQAGWQVRLLPESPAITQFLVDQFVNLTSQDIIKKRLLNWIQQSRHDTCNIASANAITLLNALGTVFVGPYGDLAGVNIAGADLTGALLDHACLQRANLRGVNLSKAFMRGTNLEEADLTEVQFGELPWIPLDGAANNICYSPDGQILAWGENNTVHLFSVTQQKEITILTGHKEEITSIAFSPNGQLIASASMDKTIRIWSLEKQKEVTCFTGHKRGHIKIAFSPNGQLLASTSGDCTLRLWSLEKQSQLVCFSWINYTGDDAYRSDVTEFYHKMFQEYEGCSIAFSPDGKLLALGGIDGVLRIWSIGQQGEMEMLIEDTTTESRKIAFSSDGKLLALGCFNNIIRLWSVEHLKEIICLTNFRTVGRITSITFSPDNQILAWSADFFGGANSIQFWSVVQQSKIATYVGHRQTVTGIAFSPDGLLLASSSLDKTIRFWAVIQSPLINCHKRNTDTGGIDLIAFSPNNQYLAASSANKNLRLWSITESHKANDLIGHTMRTNGLIFSPDSHLLISSSYDGTIRLWSVEYKNELACLVGHGEGLKGIMQIAYSPDGQLLASRGGDETVRLWSVKQRSEVACFKMESGSSSIAFSPDGQFLAWGKYDFYGVAAVQLWSIVQKSEVASFIISNKFLDSIIITFSPDSQLIASCFGVSESIIQIWLIEQKSEIARFEVPSRINSVVFSPDNQLLLALYGHGKIKLWQVAQKCEIPCFSDEKINCVAFSPNGQLLALGLEDGIIRLWSLQMKCELANLAGHADSIKCIIFSSDGKMLVSAGFTGILLWVFHNQTESLTLQVIRRYSHSPALFLGGAYVKGAILSAQNKRLLLQQGATEDKPSLAISSRHSFWSHTTNAQEVRNERSNATDNFTTAQTEFKSRQCRIS